MSGDIVWTPYLSLSSIPNKPHAMTVHDVVFERYPEYTKGRLANWYLNQAKKAARQADGLITISQFSRSEILELWRPTSPVFVATLASSKPMSVHQDLTNKVNVLYVGGFDLRKNIPALIEAFATVVRSFPEARLFLPGRYSPSSLVPDLQDIIEQFALQKHIVFPGFVSDEELAQLFQKTRVFVYPSTYEGFGLPILEAMGQGVPVICADQGAMSEVAGDAAYTVDVSDKKALAQAIKEVLESDTLAKSLQEKGYQHVENFSWGETGRSLLEAFQVIAKNYN
jgi:glycosyltransferase involved in cell wall biosynthesis